MIKAKLYNQDGVQAGDVNLPEALFGVAIKPSVVQQVVVAQNANSRKVIAHTKKRGEVRGGGKNPWKQKGTGRARQGSIRSPQWKGGGVVWGPRNDVVFTQKVNKQMKKKALAMALTQKVNEDKLFFVDSWDKVAGKTKDLFNILAKLPSNHDKTLLIVPAKQEMLCRAAKNLPKLKLLGDGSLNVVDLLGYKWVIMMPGSVKTIENIYMK
ncbi:MAG: 50S ribosomal protein L4 [Patescibacteria group bacterium]